jgi:hypothetical protein
MLHAIYTGVHCIEPALSACTCHWQRTALHQSSALRLAIICSDVSCVIQVVCLIQLLLQMSLHQRCKETK